MSNNVILQYQKAFNSIIERLKSDKSILATMVFGSMVSGDLWEESDIDLIVISNSNDDDIKNIYTIEKGIPVHIKLMGKNKFINLNNNDLKGGFLHRIFSSSKLVFSNDSEITERYDSGRYYPDLDREIWNMIYLSKVLKNIDVCKKYLANDRIYIAYSTCVKCVEDFAKLSVNSSGYMVSKDVMITAMSINNGLKEHIDKLFFNKGDKEKAIKDTINYIDNVIENNFSNIAKFILEYIKEKDTFLSAEDIKGDEMFKDYSIDFETILNKLYQKNMLKKDSREYISQDGKLLFKENVYYI